MYGENGSRPVMKMLEPLNIIDGNSSLVKLSKFKTFGKSNKL